MREFDSDGISYVLAAFEQGILHSAAAGDSAE